MLFDLYFVWQRCATTTFLAYAMRIALLLLINVTFSDTNQKF
jgi:hypothetical protein